MNDLNFKVILDDEEFNEKVEKDVKLAQELNTSLSSLLEVKAKVGKTKISSDAIKVERFKKATADAAAAQERLNTATINTASAQERYKTAAANSAAAQERLVQAKMRTQQIVNRNTAQIEKQNRAYKQQSRILNELKGYALGYLSIHGASQLLSSLVKVTGEFELQKTTLAAMLGDLSSAEQIITRIQGLAVESPFQFKELTTYAKQLSAFSVPAQELYDTTKMLADISAGLGVGMDRIVLAYGQVRSAAFLRGQEVRQFTEAGIPILDELAKQFTELEGRAVSAGEVFDKISKRLVPFEMVAKVFKDMTSEGGKFYNMQEVQAETLKGKISNLKDAYEMMLNEIGKSQSENLKGAVDWVRKLMVNYEEIGRAIVELVASYGAYKTVLAGVTLATGTFDVANHKLLSSLKSVGVFLKTNPYVAIAAGVTAAAYGLYKATTALQGYEKIQKSVSDSIEKYNAESAKEKANLDALYAKLNMATKGSEEYEKAKKSIYTNYASYISQLKGEGVEVDNLTKLYSALKDKIEDSVKARFRITEAQELTQTYEDQMDKEYKNFTLMVKRFQKMAKRDLTFEEKEGLWQYILGNEDAWKRSEVEGLRNLINNDTYNKHQVEEIKKRVQEIVNTYQEGKEKLEGIFGEEQEVTQTTTPFNYDLNAGPEGGKSAAQIAIEEQIKSINKLKDAYDKLMPYLEDVQMRATLKNLFPNISESVIDSLDFNAELDRLASRLEEFDEDAAQRLRDAISKDVAGAIADSFRAVEQYKTMLDTWMGEDFDLVGEGTAYDISKILQNLNNEYAKIDQKRQKALDLLNAAQLGDEIALAKVREVYGEEVWEKYLAKGEQVINELANKETLAARHTANEKIRDLSSKDLKERMEKANINLTNFDDKTISQVENAYDRLFSLRNQIYNELLDLKADGVTEAEEANVQRLEAELNQLSVIIEDTGVELEKKVFDRVKSGMQAISGLGSSIENLGNAMGHSGFAQFGRNITETANLVSNLMDSLKAKDTLAIIANIASAVISRIASVVTAAQEHQNALNDAAKEYAEIMLQIRRDAYSGIFGTDEMALAAENQKILIEQQKKYQESLAKTSKSRWQVFGGQSLRKESILSELGDAANADGWDLYRENGELNIAALEAYYNAYSDRFTKKQQRLIQDLIDSGNAVADAMTQQAEYLSQLFGSVADDISSAMIDAFIETGDAATDLSSIVSNVAKDMVSDLIKTVYLMPILNDYADKFKAIEADQTLTDTQKTEEKLNLLETALAQITGKSDEINETLERFSEYLGAGKETGTDLGAGIKGITEDQANLLASYLNAIRADVSYSKALWVKMDANLQKIADMLVSSPSLMEYQAQIAANTYDTAMASQAILSELRSVITSEGGDTSIRVFS